MPTSVVGRDAELASIHDFINRVDGGSAALVLEGEAGMGKTTLWRAAIERAESQALTVLQAQPVESETTLSYAGIGDLLDPVLDDVLEPLPAVQRHALSRALLLGDDEDASLDPRTLRVALLNALRTLAQRQPVLIAIDDSQWLDFASSAGLAYGVRRFRADRIGLLLSRRSGLQSVLLEELLRSPARERFTRVEVGALDHVALGRVVHEQLATSLPRPLLAEVHAAAGGNPFYALEFVRMLQRTGASIEAGQPVPLPESLHELVVGRVRALPLESRDFLLAAAAHAHPTVAITEAASGVERASGLVPALDARVVELDGERIRFTHPLLASGVYDASSPLRRLEIHRRLAELLDDPEARAWQLAASVSEPDESVGLVLEDASRHARDRGALRPAALLLERAQQLTPPDRDEDVVRRAVEAAYLHFEAGDGRRAESKLRDVIAPLAPGPLRASALVVLARVRLYERPDEARDLFLQVIDETGDDLRTLAVAHEGVGASSIWMFQRFEDAFEHTGTALALAAKLGDDALAADAVLTHLTAETLLGRSTSRTIEQALTLQHSAEHLRVMDQPLTSLAEAWIWTDSHERARETLVELMSRAQELGDESGRPWLYFLLGDVERLLGNLETARQLAREGQDASEQSGQPLFGVLTLALESMVLAELGRPDEALAVAERTRDAGTDQFVRLVTSSALAHLALVLGRPEETVAHLEPSMAFLRDEGVVEPGFARFVPDYVEALSDLDRRDDAEASLGWYEENARRLERFSALASCARCRGLLAAREGDLDAAFAAYEEALEWHERVELPLDRGRTLLALGAAQRRVKRRREARGTLQEAFDLFESIGATLWMERARGELQRISGRAASPGALTPAEERVAALVAEGKTNREVAAALYLSERTVEGHLTHVFGKLGIAHRTEVGLALATRQTQGVEPPNTGDTPVSAEIVSP